MIEGKVTFFWALIVAFAELLPSKSVTCTFVDSPTIVVDRRKSDIFWALIVAFSDLLPSKTVT